jgi:hypothetical protein
MEDKKKMENGIAQALRLCKLHFAVTTVVTKKMSWNIFSIDLEILLTRRKDHRS